MLSRLVAAPRICPRLSCAGLTRLHLLSSPLQTQRQHHCSNSTRIGTVQPPLCRRHLSTRTADVQDSSEDDFLLDEELEDENTAVASGSLFDMPSTDSTGRLNDSRPSTGRSIYSRKDDFKELVSADLADPYTSDLESRTMPEWKKRYLHWFKISRLTARGYRRKDPDTQRALDSYRARALESLGHKTVCEDAMEVSEIVAGCLTSSAHHTFMMLARLPVAQYAMVLADCCYHLRHNRERWAEIEQSVLLQAAFQEHINVLKSRQTWGFHRFRARHLDLVLEFCTVAETRQLLHDYEKFYQSPPPLETQYLMGRYTKLHDIDHALRLLSRIPFKRRQKPDRHLVGRCVNLLLLDTVQGSRTSHSFHILPAMLELGIPALEIIHNIVAQNAAKSGQLEVALDMYGYLEKEDIKTHGHTRTIILNESFKHRDAQSLDKVMTIIHEHGTLTSEPYLMACVLNIVRNICYFDRNASPSECLNHLLSVYDRAYSRQALVKMAMVDKSHLSTELSAVKEPHPVVLGSMIFAFILSQKHDQPVDRVWDTVVELLERKDPALTECIKIQNIFRAFLVFYSRKRGTLRHSLLVLDYLLKNHPDHLGETEWSIVLAGFIRFGDADTVNEVKKIMFRTGIEMSPGGLQDLLLRWPGLVSVKSLVEEIEARGPPPPYPWARKKWAEADDAHGEVGGVGPDKSTTQDAVLP